MNHNDKGSRVSAKESVGGQAEAEKPETEICKSHGLDFSDRNCPRCRYLTKAGTQGQHIEVSVQGQAEFIALHDAWLNADHRQDMNEQMDALAVALGLDPMKPALSAPPATDERQRNMREITIPRRVFEDLLEDAMELRGERDWWKNEPRCNYQRDYMELCGRIEIATKLRDMSLSPRTDSGSRKEESAIAQNVMPQDQASELDRLA